MIFEVNSIEEIRSLHLLLGKMLSDNNNLDELIECLNLTPRAEHCLKDENILTVKQLLDCSEQRLLRVPSLGRKSLNEIKDVLATRGERLAPD